MYTNVYICIIHNSQKVETTWMSINAEIDKQNIIYWYEVLFGHKKEWNELIHAQCGWTFNTSVGERSQSWKTTCTYILPLLWNSRIRKFIGRRYITRLLTVVAGSWVVYGERQLKLTVSFSCNKNILKLTNYGHTYLGIYYKSLNCTL